MLRVFNKIFTFCFTWRLTVVKPAPRKTEDCRAGIVQVTFLQVDYVKYFREIREWICSSHKHEEILNRRFLPRKHLEYI